MDSTEKLKVYIQQQISNGLSSDEIARQLRYAQWPEETIQAAFQAVQASIMPTAPAQPVVHQGANTQQNPALPTVKRGRFKTAWLLLKESLRLLNMHRSLIRYPLISAVFSFILVIVLVIAFIFGHNTLTYHDPVTDRYSAKPLGYLIIFIYYIFAYFIINYYRIGLAANVLDIFRGKEQNYAYYMSRTRTKAKTIFAFAVISATVGLILQYICERFKLLGRIVSNILGAAWSIGTLFVDPIIITTDDSATSAIKKSINLFKVTWGENIIGRVSLSLGFLYVYIVLVPTSVVLIYVGAAIGHAVGVFIALVLIFLAFLLLGLVSTAANGVLNTALFYYAENHEIPAVFTPDLINSVFIRKKRRGLFRRKTADQ